MAVGGALFGPTAARNQSKSLVEFRAGKMNLNISTKMVSPDKRKGLLSVLQVRTFFELLIVISIHHVLTIRKSTP